MNKLDKAIKHGTCYGVGDGDCEHRIGLHTKTGPWDDTMVEPIQCDEYGKPNGWCWLCWKSYQITNLRQEVQALEAWQNVAAESNRDVSAYLKEKCPSLELDSGMPIGDVRKAFEHLEVSGLSASEAVFGFCGWLTTQDYPTVMSASHDAGRIADLVGKFCKENNLVEPRDHWERKLTHPRLIEPEDQPSLRDKASHDADCCSQQNLLTTSAIRLKGLESEDQSAVHTIASAIEKLSGDLSYNNVAEAKEMLKSWLAT